jgi:hypothetical protein
MILGLSTSAFTAVHVALSLAGIATGLVVLFAMVRGSATPTWTALFLATTVLTSATGFPIPPPGLDPPRIVGILSLVLLAIAIAALYVYRLAGHWRWLYVVTATAALYLNCFVGVVQTFQKVAFFNALAPTQAEPPFAIAQGVVLVAFIVLGAVAVRRFRPAH